MAGGRVATQFKAGHSTKLGKPSPGSGRTPDWLKQKCQEIVDRAKVVEFLADVVNGSDVEQAVGGEGEVIRVPAAVRDRIKAAEILLDRGYGKPGQPLDVTVSQSELAPIPTQDLREIFAAFAGGTTGAVEGRD